MVLKVSTYLTLIKNLYFFEHEILGRGACIILVNKTYIFEVMILKVRHMPYPC